MLKTGFIYIIIRGLYCFLFLLFELDLFFCYLPMGGYLSIAIFFFFFIIPFSFFLGLFLWVSFVLIGSVFGPKPNTQTPKKSNQIKSNRTKPKKKKKSNLLHHFWLNRGTLLNFTPSNETPMLINSSTESDFLANFRAHRLRQRYLSHIRFDSDHTATG